MPRHLTRPVPRRLQKLLIDDVHKPQVFCTLAFRTIIQVRPHERQQHALATNARFITSVVFDPLEFVDKNWKQEKKVQFIGHDAIKMQCSKEHCGNDQQRIGFQH